MGSTEEGDGFLDSLFAFAPTRPPPSPLKIRNTQPSSSSLGLSASPRKVPIQWTGLPSLSVLDPFEPGPGTRLASSLLASSWWPRNGGRSRSRPYPILSPPTSPELDPDFEAGAVNGRPADFPPISLSCISAPSEPLPSPETGGEENEFKLRPATVNWEEFGSGSSAASWARGENRNANTQTLWMAIQEAGVPIYLGTPGFDAFALCPSALGTYCSPTALLTTLSDVNVSYHVYAAGRKLPENDLISSECDYEGGILQHAADLVLAEYGAAVIGQNAGPHFTFISVEPDATSDTIVRKSRGLLRCFQNNGVAKDGVIFSIPATEQGVHATRLLVKEDGMLVNLAMVAGMSHAAVCAEAGAAWITFHLDRLEKVYEDLGEPWQGIKAIQSTIALFRTHNVETKIMISGFRDTWKILEFPGAHGFSMTKEQIVSAQLPTLRSCRIPPHFASSLPEDAMDLAKGVKWPPRFFDTIEAVGPNGSFVRCFSSRVQTIVLSIQRDLFYHTSLAIRDFFILVQDDVVIYRVLMMQLLDPRTGMRTLEREGAKALGRLVNLRQDLRSAEQEWLDTTTGRLLPDVEWKPARVGKCVARITSDRRIVAYIPQQWDRRKAARRNIQADF